MRIQIQVIDDDGEPCSDRYTFGTRLTLAQALMLIQSMLALSGEFDDTQPDNVMRERLSAELAEMVNPVRIGSMLIRRTKWYITEKVAEKRYAVQYPGFGKYSEAATIRGKENIGRLYVQQGRVLLEMSKDGVEFVEAV